jgi:hypothetical protein
MKYKGFLKKSRTYDFAAILMVFGIVEQNLPMVKEQLGDWYGFIFIAVAIIVALLRRVTTGPVGKKDDNSGS